MTSSDYRRIAREKLAGRWGTAILTTFIAGLLGGLVAQSGSFNFDFPTNQTIELPPSLVQILAILVSIASIMTFVVFIIGGVIRLGYCQYLLKQHDSKTGEVRDLFSQFHRFGDGFCLSLLQSVFICLWSLLLVIPGIIATFRYAMAPFILQENPEMTASEAITASKEMMYGHKADLFLLNLSFIGWGLLSILSLGIGFLWLIPYENAAYAAFYRSLSPEPPIDVPASEI